ncbi:Fic family protein [Mesorhizobium sp. C416B]|uniref:Fic/DOC family protein n=1 Tax=unclassified Mesorhizobium TaxID=325217 RepID=UPI0003CE06DA|nr:MULTISPECIES: Fic family protein [unclassified Mesorhizobium]ESX46600.1 adenosine monophosphate-protein transferase [Mesorhizobium sp. LSHC426A00]ESX54315.1 adenosine monophosphate-protein transferase [Mesorhizobium sp. LSHC424B00]ESX72235.1 adenosine monophosphate-protein transferase [Mesorhizobium sp. LSHC416B00]WJI64485.1 Fic family protein [Mesorhizobium sp. C416B]
MVYAAEHDPLCYPGTTVLRNRLNIKDQAQLDEFELALFLTRADEHIAAGRLDFEHYKAVHHHLFQDVYEWAGEVRTIRIGKGGNWFCYPEYINQEMHRIFGELADGDYLCELDLDAFAVRAAHVLAEINAVHPFREGNGRTQLTFLAMLMENAGFPFNADMLGRENVLNAMIESFAGEETPLAELIKDIASQ